MIDGKYPNLPPNSIIFNLEQLGVNYLWDSTPYVDYLLAFPVVDYSRNNVEYLRSLGKENIHLHPVRWGPAFDLKIPAGTKDVDVLLIGAQTARRNKLLNELRGKGLIVRQATEIWGAERANALASAKVALNIRVGDAGLLESTRLCTMIASRMPVISELSDDHEENDFFSQFIPLLPVDQLCAFAADFVRSQQWASFYTEDALKKFKQAAGSDRSSRLVKFLHESLAESENPPALGLISYRKNLISKGEKGVADLLYVIDYALQRHSRFHEVEDYVLGQKNIQAIDSFLLIELIGRCWLPEGLKIMLESELSARFRNRNEGRLTLFQRKLAADIFARKGDAVSCLRAIGSDKYSIRLARSVAASIAFDAISFDAAVDLSFAQSGEQDGYLSHVLAEIYWRFNNNSRARGIYVSEPARWAARHDLEQAGIVADRLTDYGDYEAALTFYQIAGVAPKERAIAGSVDDGNAMARRRKMERHEDVRLTLERCRSYFGKVIEVNGSDIHIGPRSGGDENCIIDSGLRVFDGAFSRHSVKAAPAKTVAIIACYNEMDIIESVVRSFISQEVEVCVIDNWSQDGTWELLNLMQGSMPTLRIERFPAEGPSPTYDWTGLLRRKEELALEFPGYWVLHTDADEVRLAPWPGMSLARALGVVDLYGYNAVDFLILNFRPVDEGYYPGANPESYFGYFEVADSPDLKYQVKCWKQRKNRVDLVSRGGHFVAFEGRSVFPYKFVCKHFPLRSPAHAVKKIVTDRRGRFSSEERARGWHAHYDGVDPGKCLWNWKALTKFSDLQSLNLGDLLIHGL